MDRFTRTGPATGRTWIARVAICLGWAIGLGLVAMPARALDPVDNSDQWGHILMGGGAMVFQDYSLAVTGNLFANTAFGMASAETGVNDPLPLSLSLAATPNPFRPGESFGGGAISISAVGGPGITGLVPFTGISLNDTNPIGSGLGSFIEAQGTSTFVNNGPSTVSGVGFFALSISGIIPAGGFVAGNMFGEVDGFHDGPIGPAISYFLNGTSQDQLFVAGVLGKTAFAYFSETPLADGSISFGIAAVSLVEGMGNPLAYTGVPLPLLVNPGGFADVSAALDMFSDPGATTESAPLPASLLADIPADALGAGAFEAAAVPEPSSLALCGLGLAGLAGYARRRRTGRS